MPPLTFAQPCGLRVWDEEIQNPAFDLHQGFCYSRLDGCQDAFRFAALIDTNQFASMFKACATMLAEESFFVLEYYPEKIQVSEDDALPEPTVFYSPYIPTQEILDTIAPYMERLIHDGFVGFGLANSRQGVELFYSEEKAFTCFTANHIRTMDIFTQHGLSYTQELIFPADFAHDHLSLVSIDADKLPGTLRKLAKQDLDYINYCSELIELFDMQSTSDGEDFFLSGKEQDLISAILEQEEDLDWSSEDEFVHLMMDWKEFVKECSQGFDGDLDDYLNGIQLRDIIALVIDNIDADISKKLADFIDATDAMFRRQLVTTERHIPSGELSKNQLHQQKNFWRWGVIRQQSAELRRDLIRLGWFSKN
ncbi:MAG: hypothetical protein RBR22_11695 [Desulfuromonas sp.]|nr:hypothetical protein [Desulfuromonas sp.]